MLKIARFFVFIIGTLLCINVNVYALELSINQINQSDGEIKSRIAFIQQRFENGNLYANLWQYGWLTGFSASIASRLYIIGSDSGDKQFDASVGVFTSLSGVLSLTFKPLPSNAALSELKSLPESTFEQRKIKLNYAEQRLIASANEAKRRRGWKIQGVFFLEQLLAGLAIGIFDHRPKDGLRTAAIGMIASELFTFSMPTQSIQDLEDYSNASFNSQPKTTTLSTSRHFALIPQIGGLRLVYLF